MFYAPSDQSSTESIFVVEYEEHDRGTEFVEFAPVQRGESGRRLRQV
jgi:hypothetical protein